MSLWQLTCVTRNMWSMRDLHHWKIYKSTVAVDLHCHIKMHYLASYHMLLAEFGELLWNYMHLYAIGFQQRLAHLPSSWLINQATSLSSHLAIQGFDTWYKMASD